MTGYVAGRWLLLAILWSLQYIFMRVSVPVFGAGLVAEARGLSALMFLAPWMLLVARQQIGLRLHWKDHLAIALVNNVLPFICFAWAASVLPAGYLAVINGMVPLSSAVISAPVLGERLGWRRVAGFMLGIVGVAFIVRLGPVELDLRTVLATLVAIAGSFFWGWAGVLIKQRAGRVPAMSIATGSIVFTTLILAPAWASAPPLAEWTPAATAGAVALGALCSGVAYLPFFTLVRDIGPTRTLTVGLAVPVLGIVWGWLILGEAVTAPMLFGAALVLGALALVQRKGH